MKTAKEEVRSLLDSLPDDVSLDEILRGIEVLASIERGMADLRSGRLIPHSAVVARLTHWKHRSSGR